MTAGEMLQRARDFIFNRKTDYCLTFQMSQPANVRVLKDLARFGRADKSCVVPGDRDLSLVLEGRREMWLRIEQHLKLTPDQLFELYTGEKT